MRLVNTNEVIDQSHLNKFFLSTFFICLLTRVFDGYEINIMGTALPAMMKSGELNAMAAGLLASASFYGMIFGSVLLGMLADRVGARHGLAVCAVLYAVFTGVCGFTTSPIQFAVFRFVSGMGMAGAIPILTALLSEYSPLSTRATLTTTACMGTAFGAMLASGAGILLLDRLGMHYQWLFVLGFFPLLLIPLTYQLPNSMAYYLKKNDKESIRKFLKKAAPGFMSSDEDDYTVRALPGGKKASFVSLFQPGLLKNTLLFSITMFIIMFTFYGLNVWIPRMMTRQGYALGSSLMMMFLFNSGGIIAYPGMGLLADRMGYRSTLTSCYVAFGLLVVCFGALPNNFLLLALIIFFAGGIGTTLIALTSVYVGVCHPVAIRSTAVGTIMAIGRVGGAVGPTILGMFQYYKVSFLGTLLFIGAVAVMGGVMIVLTKDNSRLPQSASPQDTCVREATPA